MLVWAVCPTRVSCSCEDWLLAVAVVVVWRFATVVLPAVAPVAGCRQVVVLPAWMNVAFWTVPDSHLDEVALAMTDSLLEMTTSREPSVREEVPTVGGRRVRFLLGGGDAGCVARCARN